MKWVMWIGELTFRPADLHWSDSSYSSTAIEEWLQGRTKAYTEGCWYYDRRRGVLPEHAQRAFGVLGRHVVERIRVCIIGPYPNIRVPAHYIRGDVVLDGNPDAREEVLQRWRSSMLARAQKFDVQINIPPPILNVYEAL